MKTDKLGTINWVGGKCGARVLGYEVWGMGSHGTGSWGVENTGSGGKHRVSEYMYSWHKIIMFDQKRRVFQLLYDLYGFFYM